MLRGNYDHDVLSNCLHTDLPTLDGVWEPEVRASRDGDIRTCRARSTLASKSWRRMPVLVLRRISTCRFVPVCEHVLPLGGARLHFAFCIWHFAFCTLPSASDPPAGLTLDSCPPASSGSIERQSVGPVVLVQLGA